MKFKEFLESSNTYPNGVYVAVLPDTETDKSIKAFQKKHLSDVSVNEKLHSTIIYSSKPRKDRIETSSEKHEAVFDGFDLFGEDKNILVMKIKSDSLYKRNDFLTKKYDFVSDFDSYLAHITLAYDVQDFDPKSLPDFTGKIVLGNEYSEDIDEDA